MALPRRLTQALGALVVSLAGGTLVAAFYPGWDPRPLFDGVIESLLTARLALAGLAVFGLVAGFPLLSRPPPVSARRLGATTQGPTLAAQEEMAEPVLHAAPKGPRTEREAAMEAIDAEIRVLNRKIGKARVLLGTGQLSDDGYSRYVRTLEQERAALERRRVSHELLGTAGTNRFTR